jgi:hypothetical protein
MAMPTVLRPSLGPIEAHVLYPLEDFKPRSGFGSSAMRAARRDGLKVIYAGGRGYVLGRDFIEWLQKNGKPEHKGRA